LATASVWLERTRLAIAPNQEIAAARRSTGSSRHEERHSLGVAIFGGTATYIMTWLVGVTGNPLASTYYVMAANVVMLLAVLAVRQTDFEPKKWPPPVDRDV
jgi:hypothetical protein